jgi:high-affinity nickel-transport protein
VPAIDPVVAAALLGMMFGLQHATDADHLVAVATIVSRERRFAEGALVGALWGLGHTLTLACAGLAIVLLDLRVPDSAASGLELIVAVMLVALGVWRLRDAVRGLSAAAGTHFLADHDHGGREVVHTHAHTHGADVHAHPHVHPSRRLLDALAARRNSVPVRALMVGAVHGMAGSAAISLLALATTRSTAASALYLALFGLGTIAGMTLLTAAMAYPVSLALKFERARRGLAMAAGLGSIGFGLLYGWQAL